jgi:DNA polymerase I-like protein with 3'-5' exonuclease and polymerase domains
MNLPSWSTAKRVAIDIETNDPSLKKLGPGVRRDGYIVGISFCLDGEFATYLPIAHEAPGNMNEDQVREYINDSLWTFKGELVGCNLSYDLDFITEWLGDSGPGWRHIKLRDVQVAEPLINELADSYSLESLAQKYLGQGKDESKLREVAARYELDPKRDLWRLPPRYVSDYAIADARLPLQILRKQERILQDEGLVDIWELESKVLPILVQMRRHGVRIDFDKLDAIEALCLNKELEQLAHLKHLTGIEVQGGDVWKADVISAPLYHIGATPPRTEKTDKPSVDRGFLEGLKHPVADAILGARKYNKIRTTFCASVREHAVKDRLHCTFNQLKKDREAGGMSGTVTGRLSCTQPNLQQTPARDPELGPLWRSLFLPDEGKQWAALDFSQQEPRILTHYAELMKFEGASEAAHRYRTDPSTDMYSLISEMTGLDRKNAKTILLGLSYGMGGAKLCHRLALPTKIVQNGNRRREVAGPEGEDLLRRFNEGAPFVKLLSDRVSQAAEQRGYIKTLLGRRCRFPFGERGRREWTHKALNRLIQGSAADQTKASLVAATEAGYRIQLQIHDELDLSVSTRAEAEEVAEIMRTAVPLRVPMQVDVEIGKNWGEAK